MFGLHLKYPGQVSEPFAEPRPSLADLRDVEVFQMCHGEGFADLGHPLLPFLFADQRNAVDLGAVGGGELGVVPHGVQIPAMEIVELRQHANLALLGDGGVNLRDKLFIPKQFGIQILDTRKTAPGLRVFDKLAVRLGGGTNHRFGLYDQILIKDNHIACAGSITQAVTAARSLYKGKRIEVETTTLSEVQEALDSSCDIIMLDNMPPALIAQCVELIQKRAQIEVSGGITLETLDQYLIPGVDFISVGSLTHSVKSVDISLEVEIGI